MPAISMMRNTCTIRAVADAQSTSSAGLTRTVGSDVTGVTCSIQQTGGSSGNYEGRILGVRQFEVFFPAGTVVGVGYLLTGFSGPSGLSSGDVLQVTSDPVDNAGMASYVVVTAQEPDA